MSQGVPGDDLLKHLGDGLLAGRGRPALIQELMDRGHDPEAATHLLDEVEAGLRAAGRKIPVPAQAQPQGNGFPWPWAFVILGCLFLLQAHFFLPHHTSLKYLVGALMMLMGLRLIIGARFGSK